jgi:acetyl esterase/lipase
MSEEQFNWTGNSLPLFDMYIGAMVEEYYASAIFKWTDLPFSIRKDMIRSDNYHNGGARNWMVGIYGEVTWTRNNPNNQPCDVTVDEYFQRACPSKETVVVVMNDSDYAELISFILEAIKAERECREQEKEHTK